MVATKSNRIPIANRQEVEAAADSVFIRSNNVLNKVHYSSISYIHADGNYCYVFAGDRKFVVKVSLKRLMNRLKYRNFIRIHKSYIVQLPFIRQIDLNNSLIVIADQQIPIGRAYKNDLIDRLEIL